MDKIVPLIQNFTLKPCQSHQHCYITINTALNCSHCHLGIIWSSVCSGSLHTSSMIMPAMHSVQFALLYASYLLTLPLALLQIHASIHLSYGSTYICPELSVSIPEKFFLLKRAAINGQLYTHILYCMRSTELQQLLIDK